MIGLFLILEISPCKFFICKIYFNLDSCNSAHAIPAIIVTETQTEISPCKFFICKTIFLLRVVSSCEVSQAYYNLHHPRVEMYVLKYNNHLFILSKD